MSSYSVSVGASLTQAGIVAGAFSIAALVLRPFGGFFSDHFNKKYLLVFTTILFTLCFLGYSVCHTVLSLTAIRMIHGAAFGINSTVNLALATEFIPDDRMGEGIGFFGIGQVVSQVIGPTIGMWIRDRCGFTVLFLGAAGLVFFSAMVILAGFGYRPEGGAGVRLTEDISLKSFRPGNLIAKECILYALIGGLFSVGNGVTSADRRGAGHCEYLPFLRHQRIRPLPPSADDRQGSGSGFASLGCQSFPGCQRGRNAPDWLFPHPCPHFDCRRAQSLW